MANNKIQFKRTTISGRTPNTTNSGNTSYIDAGEFAVNLTDQKIYSSNGTVSFEVGANLTSLAVSTITAGNTTVTGDLTVNNYVIAANGATSAYATKYLVEYNPTTKDLTYSSKPDASRPYITGYGQEIHVSPVALDDTGNGTIGDPVKTIAQALVLAAAAFETTSAGERKTIILHPGDYAANVTINTQFLSLTTHESVGKNTTLSGTLTINKGCTVDGLKMTNLVIAANSSVGTVDLIGCTVTTATTKTAGAYTVFRACDLSSSTLNITGGGSVVMVGGNYGNVTVANTSAGVLAKAVVTMGPTTLTSGTMQISDTLVYAASNTASAITQSAGSILTLNNSQTLIPDLSNVARNTFGGFYSILHSVYDKTNSTFGGTSLAAVDHGQHLNIDKLIVGNTTVNVAITSTAITSNATLAAGNTTVTGFANVSSTLQVGGNVVLSSTTGISANGSVGSAGQGLVSNGSAVYWSNNAGYTGSAGFTGSQGATGFTGSKGTTTISNTAPTSPVNGDTWWNSETGVRYVYYADGTSNQWVQESAAGTTGFTGSAGTNGFTGSRGFTGSQGATGFTGSGGGVTTFDGGSTGLSPYSATSGAVSLGGTLNVGYGGTGTSTSPSNGQILVGNSSGGYSVSTLTAGNGAFITSTSNTITIGVGSAPAPPAAYISQIQFTNGANSYNNYPISQATQSPTVFYDSGTFEATVWFYSPQGPYSGYNTQGNSISQIVIQDNAAANYTFNSGTDFSLTGNWYVNNGVAGFYGLSITNATLRTLMADTMAELTAPHVGPRSNSEFAAQGTIYADVSGGPAAYYASQGRPVMLRTASNGSKEIVFKSNNSTASYGLSLNYLQITYFGGQPYFYSGTDFTAGFVFNENGAFLCQLTGLSANLQILFDNTIII